MATLPGTSFLLPTWTLTQGDHSLLPLGLRQADQVTPLDITGWTFSAEVRHVLAGPLIAYIATTVNVSTGTVTLELSASASSAIRAGKYLVELKRTDSGFEQSYVIVEMVLNRSIRTST